MAAHQHDLGRIFEPADFDRQFDTIHFRHDQIEQGDMGMDLPDEIESQGAAVDVVDGE